MGYKDDCEVHGQSVTRPIYPYPYCDRRSRKGGGHKIWTLQNQGYGPALNITHPKVRSDTQQTMAPPVMHGGSHQFCEAKEGPDSDNLIRLLKSPSGFEIEYASIVGERFRSVCRVRPSEGADVEFENLSRPNKARASSKAKQA